MFMQMYTCTYVATFLYNRSNVIIHTYVQLNYTQEHHLPSLSTTSVVTLIVDAAPVPALLIAATLMI